MRIIEERYDWRGALTVRGRTDAIILHHAEATYATAQDVHRWHLGNGWAGIGYHYYVRKNGLVYRGRPEDAVGAHAGSKSGYNGRSIGVCFEGDYMTETMPTAQLEAGRALLRDIEARYGGGLRVIGHRDVTATDCPGTRFPMDAMKHHEEDEDMYTIYKTIKDVPDWGRECVNDLIAKGYLKGDGDGQLDLEHYMLRTLVIGWRAGLYR